MCGKLNAIPQTHYKWAVLSPKQVRALSGPHQIPQRRHTSIHTGLAKAVLLVHVLQRTLETLVGAPAKIQNVVAIDAVPSHGGAGNVDGQLLQHGVWHRRRGNPSVQ